MIKKVIGICFLGILLTACNEDEKQKEFNVDEVVAAWNKDGEHAPLVEEVRQACKKTADKGKDSPACTVYNLAQFRMASKELMEKTKQK